MQNILTIRFFPGIICTSFMSVVNLPLIKMADRGGKWQGIHTLKGKNKSKRQRNKAYRREKTSKRNMKKCLFRRGNEYINSKRILNADLYKTIDC